MQCGSVVLEKQSYFESSDPPLVLLHCQLPAMEVLMACVAMGWMAVLVSFVILYRYIYNVIPFIVKICFFRLVIAVVVRAP